MSALRIAHPGSPAVLVREPEVKLTPRQEQVLHIVRSFNGNRLRSAQYLGLSLRAVQHHVNYAIAAGVAVPPVSTRYKRWPKPRELGPRCGKVMVRHGDICARPADHEPAPCHSSKSWYRGKELRRASR